MKRSNASGSNSRKNSNNTRTQANSNSNNLRSTSNSNNQRIFNQTQSSTSPNAPSNKVTQLSKQGNGVTVPILADLYKASTYQKEEIHDLMAKVQMPDDSLTLSSMSMSPFQHGRSKRQITQGTMGGNSGGLMNLSNTNGTHEQSNDNENTLGRSELEATSYDINKTSTGKSLSITRRNQTGQHSYLDDDEEQPSRSQIDYTEDESQLDQFTSEGPPRRRRLDMDEVGKEEDSYDEDNHFGGRDSPDFNRGDRISAALSYTPLDNHTTNNEVTHDDLTISQTVISNPYGTSRGAGASMNLQQPENSKRGSTNRTFADSIIQQQYCQHTSSSNNNTHRNYYSSNQESARNRVQARNFRNEEGGLSTDDNQSLTENGIREVDDHSEEEEEEDTVEREDPDSQDGSEEDISCLNSFTQTQYSKHSKLAYSRMTAGQRQGARLQVPSDMDMSRKRSPNVQRNALDHDESMSLTPSSNDGKWLSQKSQSNMAINRTVGSDVSSQLNKLATNLPQMLQNNNMVNRTQQNMVGRRNVNNSSFHNNDPELYQALSEENTLERNTIDNEEAKRGALRSGVNTDKNQLFELSQMKIKYKKLQADYDRIADDLEGRDHLCQQQQQIISQLELQIQDHSDHIELLTRNIKSESSLPQLRGKALDLAKSEIKNYKAMILEKDSRIKRLEYELNKRDAEDKTQYVLFEDEIRSLNDQIHKFKILLKSNKKEIKSNEEEYLQFKQNLEQQFQAQLSDYQSMIDQLNKQLRDKDDQNRQLRKDLKIWDNKVQDLQNIIEQKDKITLQIQNDKDKFNTELKSFKDRCRDLENEISQMRSGENTSMFVNSSKITGSKDFEIKQIREIFDKQLNKTKEQNTKLNNQVKDLELRLQTVEEEKKRLMHSQISLNNDKFDKDQEIINELSKVKQELNHYKNMESDIRLCFNMSDREDISSKLMKINQDIEMIPLLQNELEKSKIKLEEVQKQLINNQKNQLRSGSQEKVSNFTANLIVEKTKELEKLRSEFSTLQEVKDQFSDQILKYEVEIDHLHSQNDELTRQIQNLSQDLQKTRDLKDKSDKNVDELKEKLRNMIREKQELQSSRIQQEKVQERKTNYLDEVERKKYNELIDMILDLDLATDPLQSVDLALQESYIDEYEQAVKHLNEQKRLVNDLVNQLRSDQLQMIEQMKGKDILIQENIVCADKNQKEIQKLLGVIQEKDRNSEYQNIEIRELTASCERLAKNLKEVENINTKLREENEQNKSDLRKLMRTQEHLYKDSKKSVNNSVIEKSSSSLIDQERLMMSYEDLISKLINRIEKIKIKQVQEVKEVQQHEFIETLDQLIECSTKGVSTLGDLAVQINKRLDKIRSQERLRMTAQIQQQASLKSSEIQMCEPGFIPIQNVNQDVLYYGTLNNYQSNDEDLKQSLMKLMKNPNKNFFNNEDNNSLLFSDLVDKNSQHANNEEIILQLKQKEEKIKELEKRCEDLQIIISQSDNNQSNDKELQNKIINLTQELKQKDNLLKEQEDQFRQNIRDIEDQQRIRNQKMWQEVEALKEQMKHELTNKSQRLDSEYDELQILKERQRSSLAKQQDDLEKRYTLKFEQQEKEYLAKLQKFEQDIRMSQEQSKDEQLSNLCKSLEEQYQGKIKLITDEHQSLLLQIKSENQSKLEDLKRIKDREIKKLKEEIERIKKTMDDKLKKFELEFQNEKDVLDREWKDKLDQNIAKHKKEIKNAQDKVRAEMRNSIDSVKNEMAKQKAEFEREKKKIVNDHANEILQMNRDFEERLDQEIKNSKLKLEGQFKKRLDDKEKQTNAKVEEFDLEIIKLKESHSQELKKERERLELILKDQVRGDVRLELHQEIELEFRDQIDRIKQQHLIELDRMRTKYDLLLREERASSLPRLEEEESRVVLMEQSIIRYDVAVQCEIALYPAVIDEQMCVINQNNQSMINPNISMVNQSQYSSNTPANVNNQSQYNSMYIESLKQNFEEELERQQQVFEIQLVQRQNISVRIFEELMILEFDKILQSIYHKQANNQNIQQLDAKRREINNLISDILSRNDDGKERQMKNSLDNLKKKMSEVLRAFKIELENKINSKNATAQQILKEKLKIPNMSDIVSENKQNNDDQESEYSCTSSIQQTSSQAQSFAPTPRNNNDTQEQQSDRLGPKLTAQYPNILNKSNDKNQLSDIKNYISEDLENNQNVLKKVQPVPNLNGVPVVEVSKVVRDLNVLLTNMKQSKFYKCLIFTTDEQKPIEQDETSQYRILLNDFFRLIVQFNQGIDTLSKQSEVYKLKLLNTELRERMHRLEQECQFKTSTADLVDSILNYFSNKTKSLSEDSLQCLSALENTMFQINKLQLRIQQVIELFTLPNQSDTINQSIIEINKNCQAFVQLYPQFEQQTIDNGNLIMSHNDRESPVRKISPEMLSPEETAQLIASVFQRLNNTQMAGGQQPLETTYQSFFQTFMSNDDYVRSAENFIQKYRENMNQTQKNSNMPMQVVQGNQGLRNQKANRQFQSMHYGGSQDDNLFRKRSRSQHSLNTANSRNQQTYVSNVFQSNLLDQKSMQSNFQPNKNTINYDTCSQSSYSNQQIPFTNHSNQVPPSQHGHNQSLFTNFTRQDSLGKLKFGQMQQMQQNSTDDLSTAQSQVNALFDRIKSNFTTQGGQPPLYGQIHHQQKLQSREHSFQQ